MANAPKQLPGEMIPSSQLPELEKPKTHYEVTIFRPDLSQTGCTAARPAVIKISGMALFEIQWSGDIHGSLLITNTN